MAVSSSMRTARGGRAGARVAGPGAGARRARSVRRAAGARESWYPGSEFPEHLDGTMIGDNGFDPLGLGSDPETMKWMRQAELQHCRWAMLGAAGILVPEILTAVGAGNFPEWNVAGAAAQFPKEEIPSLVFAQVALMGWAEFRRWADIDNPGSVNEDPIFKGNKCTGTEVGYPAGKWFDPLGYSNTSEEKLNDLKKKEIANGRLAMVAVFGFATQTFITGKGPIANLSDHLADPSANTIFTQVQ